MEEVGYEGMRHHPLHACFPARSCNKFTTHGVNVEVPRIVGDCKEAGDGDVSAARACFSGGQKGGRLADDPLPSPDCGTDS
jgi:hypothetical protein